MALDLFFRSDIRNVLRSAYLASEGPAALVAELLRDPELQNVPMGKLLRVYREGYLQALNAVGVAFGLDLTPPPQVEPQYRPVEPPRADKPSKPRRDDVPELDMNRFLWLKRQYERRR